MKFTIAFASIAALIILAPAPGFAADPLPVTKPLPKDAPVNTSRSNISRPGVVEQPGGATANPAPAKANLKCHPSDCSLSE